MEAASNNQEANPQAKGRDATDEFSGSSVEGNTAGLAALEAAEREKSAKARDRRETIKVETARCEKVLKATRTGKQGRLK